MNKIFILLLFTLSPFYSFSQSEWQDLAVTEDMEVYIDPSSIKDVDGRIYAKTKTIYTTQNARNAYVGKIKNVFKKDADKKISKWNSFSYTIAYGLYDCTNKRFKILEVQDYGSDNTKIIQTKTLEDKSRWLEVDVDTVGDYLLFYICDYENK
ncbi:MAG: hypothetical protein RL662_1797 [Bacteroidota bacterium]|jgi:hypothetical protein